MYYRRLRIEGASYFFTIVTERRRRLFDDPATVALFDKAQILVQSRHPFEIEAQVILPDHLHSIWHLPVGDSNFTKRWRPIKSYFTHWYLKHNAMPNRSGRSCG